MKQWRWVASAGALLVFALLGVSSFIAQATPALSIAEQMDAFWQGKAHFQEVRDTDWKKPPYNSPREGEGWFGNPMPSLAGKWYLFNRGWLTKEQKPVYCPDPGFKIIVRESSDEGRSWSNPAVVAAAPGPVSAPDACGVTDGSSYYDEDTDTWQMLAQCRAAHYDGGWMLCHYVRHGPSPMGSFIRDTVPSIRGGQLWSQICSRSGGACDPRKTIDEGTPDIIYKKSGYFYVTFHGYDYSTKHGFRGVAKTDDFHHWIVLDPDLPNGPIFAAPECRAWNAECVGGGEASTLIAGNYQYMLIETPDSFSRRLSRNWSFALLRAPMNTFPAASSPNWERFVANPLLPAREVSNTLIRCGVAYVRWAIGANHVYILYANYGCRTNSYDAVSISANRLIELVPGAGLPVSFSSH